MISETELMEIENTLETTAVYVCNLKDRSCTLCLYSCTDDENVIFSDRCGNLYAYSKASYGTEWACEPIKVFVNQLNDIADAVEKAFQCEWTGDEFLTETEEKADRIADFLEALGFDYAVTGYYDPEQDERDNCVDNCTGKWYVSVD